VLSLLSTLSTLLVLLDGGTSPAWAAPYPAGFGRFGRFHDEGLLTLNVSPQGFSTPTLVHAPPLDFRFGSGKAPTVVVKKIDAAEKILLLTGGGDDTPVALHYTLLYPGFSARWGRSLRLRLSEGGGSAPRMVVERLASTRSSQTICFLLRRTDKPCVPVALVFRSPRARSLRPKFPHRVSTSAW
jgi:hypothetical protein